MRTTRIIILALSIMLATPAFAANFSAINIGDVLYINRFRQNNDTVRVEGKFDNPIAQTGTLPEYDTNASDSHNEYKLRPDTYQPGRKTEFAAKMRLENGKLIKNSQITEAKVAISGDFIRAVEIMSVSGGQPSVIKQTYVSQTTKTSMTEKGETHDSLQYGPFHGKTMLIEFSEGQRKISFIGEPPKVSNIDADFVYTSEDAFYPSDNVRIGQEWTIRGKQLAMLWGFANALTVEGDSVFRFNKVTTYQGVPCALIEWSTSMKVDVLSDEGEEVDMSIEGTGVGYRSLSDYIDLSKKNQGTMKIYLPRSKITIVGPVTVDYTANILKEFPSTTVKIPARDVLSGAGTAQPSASTGKQATTAYLVFFDQNLAKLTPEAQKVVEAAATQARAKPDYQIEVIGHDDSVLPDHRSLTLSQERAMETARSLLKKGVPANRILVGGIGSKEPLVPTARGVAEPRNRVVRIQIVPNAEKTRAYLQPFK